MRSGMLSLLLVFPIIAGCTSEEKKLETLKHHLQNKLVSAPEGAIVAIAYEDLTTGGTVLINEREQMHAASTMKVPVMIEVYKQAAKGRFSLTDSIVVVNSFKSIVDSSVYSMDVGEDSDDSVYELIGGKSTVYDLTYQMITVSSNLATNILIEKVGAKNVMETLTGIGVTDMQVLRGVEDIKAYELGLSNTTNAVDMMRVMSAIARDEVVSPEACAEMRKILLDQKFNTKIPALLPEEVKVAHKTGWITGISHDCAIVYPPNGKSYSLTILTKGIESHEDAEALIAELSKEIYDYTAGN